MSNKAIHISKPINKGKSKKIIYIDIGHNVKYDNGAYYEGGLSENDCATQIGLTAIKMLNRWGYDARIALTEENKRYIETLNNPRFALNESLRLRCEEANKNNADLFVSIHLNANPESVPEKDRKHGTSIFVKTHDEATLANCILYHICNSHYDLGPDQFNDGTTREGKPFKNNGIEDGRSLYVLKNTNCKAILVENIYVDNPMDFNVYLDKAPYVNHEHTKLEEGVDYVCENVFSYNFFGYCIARGIEDYFNGYVESDIVEKSEDATVIDCNYVCYTDSSYEYKLPIVFNSNGFREDLYGKNLLSVLRYIKTPDDKGVTKLYLPYQNYNSILAGYATLNHCFKSDGLQFRNLANLGKLVTIKADVAAEGIASGYGEDHEGLGVNEKAIEFMVREQTNILRSDGSYYCAVEPGSIVGVYLDKTVKGIAPHFSVIYETYNGAKGPIRCEPTRPNWIKVNYIIRPNGEKENLYNIFTGDNYAWIETNLNKVVDMDKFTFVLLNE